MRDFSYLWVPERGLFDDPTWLGVYNARSDYLRLPIRIHEESQRLPKRPFEHLHNPDGRSSASEQQALEHFLRGMHDIMPLHATYFDRIGTIIFGFSLLERACQMATTVLLRNRIAVIPWHERSRSLTHKIEELLRGDLRWSPSDGELWADLRALYELRNAFVHAGGYFDSRSHYGTKVIAAAQKLGIGMSDWGFFVVDEGVDLIVGTFLEPTDAILQRISDIVALRKQSKA